MQHLDDRQHSSTRYQNVQSIDQRIEFVRLVRIHELFRLEVSERMRKAEVLITRRGTTILTRGRGFVLALSTAVAGLLQCGSDVEVAQSPGSSDGVSAERQRSAAAGPDSTAIYTRRGRRYMREQTYEKAIAQLSQAVRLKPDSHEAQDMLGMAHAFRLTPGKAIEHIEKAIALQPGNGAYHMHLGKAHMLLTDYAGAKVAYERAIELGLKKGKPYYDLGIISEREGRLDDARTYYEKAVEVVPRFAPSCNLRLGIIAEKTGDDSGAVALYSAALKGNPTLTTAHYRIAQLYLKDGRESLAEKHLQTFRQQKAAERSDR